MSRLTLYIFICTLTAMACQNAEPQRKPTETQASAEQKQDDSSKDQKVIVFFGNSLTAGYGLDEGEDFPSLIQNRLDSLGYQYTVVNAGLSGETTAGGVNRIDWILNQKMDVFVLELGANDMLRGFDLASTRSNLQTIIDKVKKEKPNVKIVLAGMQAPPNLGKVYTDEFASIYQEIAKSNEAVFIPFLLDGVAGNPELNLKDGIHPNEKGQYVVRDNVWKALKPIL